MFRKYKHLIFYMNLTRLFYFMFTFQLLATNLYSQDKVTLSLENTSLEQIINEIEEQTTYRFILNNDQINIKKRYRIKVNKKGINETIKLLLQNTKIQHQIQERYIILSKKKEKLITKKALQNYTLSGTITDAKTGETLIGAEVVANQNRGTVTNTYGFYSITLPEGEHSIFINYLGYQIIVNHVNLNNNIRRDYEMTPEEVNLDEVVLVEKEISKSHTRNVLAGVNVLTAAEIKKLPSFFGEPDITRAILTQPGVSSVGEGTAGFNVRGGNIDQNLVLIDEAPLYVSSHLWGLFSVVNTDAIKNMTLYKGGIPARFGGRASSVLDIQQKEGNTKQFSGEGGLGTLFSRVTLGGPIKKDKLNFLVSGRRSYFDIFFPIIGDEFENTKLSFYDLSTKLTWKINENNKLFFSGYFGADKMKFSDSVDGNEKPVGENKSSIDFNWKNTAATIRWNHLFSSRLFMNLSGIYSRYRYELNSENDSGGIIKTRGAFKWKSGVENIILKPDLTYYLNPETIFRFGLNSTLYTFTPAKLSSNNPGLSPEDIEEDKGLEFAPYLEFEKKTKKLSFNLGMRYSWFGNMGPKTISLYNPNLPMSVNSIIGEKSYRKNEITKSYSGFEPRVSVKYNLDKRKALKLGYNRSFQYIHLISNSSAVLPYDIWKPVGKHIKPLEVNQISGGYAFDTSNRKYSLTLEAYYKTFKNLVEYKNGADLFINKNIETQLLPAKGYAYGLELAMYKNSGRFTGNVNYTYSQTKRKTTSPFDLDNINNGNYYSSNYDRPHLLNITANYKLNKTWDIGLFFTYQTGRPFTAVTGRLTIDDNAYLTYSNRNAYRMKNIHRLDLSFGYIPKGNPKTKWQSSWNFGVYNVYGNKNPFSKYSTFNNSQLRTYEFSLLGSPVPFITYNFKF